MGCLDTGRSELSAERAVLERREDGVESRLPVSSDTECISGRRELGIDFGLYRDRGDPNRKSPDARGVERVQT